MNRSEARKNAFIVCFERQFNDEDLDFLLEYSRDHMDMEFDKLALDLIKNVEEHKKEVDKIIELNLKRWTISRIHKVCLIILEMAIVEILYFDKIPYKVTANEYIELAKQFTYADDVSFINGVVGSVLKDKIVDVKDTKNTKNIKVNKIPKKAEDDQNIKNDKTDENTKDEIIDNGIREDNSNIMGNDTI